MHKSGIRVIGKVEIRTSPERIVSRMFSELAEQGKRDESKQLMGRIKEIIDTPEKVIEEEMEELQKENPEKYKMLNERAGNMVTREKVAYILKQLRVEGQLQFQTVFYLLTQGITGEDLDKAYLFFPYLKD